MYNVGYGIINQQYPWQMFGKEQICVPKFHAKYANTDLPRKDMSHWGTYWKCIHFIMSTDNVQILIHQQLLYIYKSPISQ